MTLSSAARLQRLSKQRALAMDSRPASLPVANHHPNDIELNSRLEQSVLELRQNERPVNTVKAIDTKIAEYFQFCDYAYPGQMYRHILSYERVYRFMYYQSFRPQKKRGGKKQLLDEGQRFDKDAYELVLAQFRAPQSQAAGDDSEEPVALFPTVDPATKPVSKSSFDQYKAALRLLYRQQVAQRCLSTAWDHIWQMGLDEMAKHVKERGAKVKKETFAEKCGSEFTPYLIVESYNELEQCLWDDSSTAVGRRNICCNLRHRYCLLHLTTGILRCESLYRAELSDFLMISPPKREKDVHRMELMINQIAFGKTNHGRILYGRATRHKDVRICCMGALAHYLMYREHATGELGALPAAKWLINSEWFGIKLLVDINGSDNTKELSNDSYSGHIKKVLKRLGLPLTDVCHLGRKLGPKVLEYLEEESEEIRRMGQWNHSVYDNSYSSKLPMRPIRKLAGFGSDSQYFNTRTTVEPPDVLLKATPIGKWVYRINDEILEHVIDNGGYGTAIMVLGFFQRLNRIFLQDCAALLALHPVRCHHPLFHTLDVFDLPEWEVYLAEMKQAIENEEDPVDANLDKVLPGIRQWHSVNRSGLETVCTKIDALAGSFREGFQQLNEGQSELRAHARQKLQQAFINVASQLNDDEDGLSPSFEEEDADDSSGGNAEDVPNMSKTTFTMAVNHMTLQDLYDEWHGTGRFQDLLGGIEGRNKKYGSRWRKHFDSQTYSRTARVVSAIKKHAEQNSMTEQEAVALLEEAFQNGNRRVYNMVVHCQNAGLLEKKASRGKKRKNDTTEHDDQGILASV